MIWKIHPEPILLSILESGRKPAEMAGLGALHDFLCRGFEAFNTMSSVGDLSTRLCKERHGFSHKFSTGILRPFIKDSDVIDQPIKMVMD